MIVTRSEAEQIVDATSGGPRQHERRRLARTVVVLYDENHTLQSELNLTLKKWISDRRTMQRCIARLRDGWQPRHPGSHYWCKQIGGSWVTEPMTPEEIEVMSQ